MLELAGRVQEMLRREYQQELTFFRKFHRNRINWAIHAVTIPMEWTASLLILSIFRLHWMVAAATAVYHLILFSKKSIPAFVAQFLFCWAAQMLHQHFGNVQSVCVALMMHIIAWVAQVVIGHRMLEGNWPAMATKLSINSVVLSVILAWDSY